MVSLGTYTRLTCTKTMNKTTIKNQLTNFYNLNARIIIKRNRALTQFSKERRVSLLSNSHQCHVLRTWKNPKSVRTVLIEINISTKPKSTRQETIVFKKCKTYICTLNY